MKRSTPTWLSVRQRFNILICLLFVCALLIIGSIFFSGIVNDRSKIKYDEAEAPGIAVSGRSFSWLMLGGCALLVIGIFIAAMLSRNISRLVTNLTESVSTVTSGHYLSNVNFERQDELGQLARAINAMAIEVQRSRDELEKKAQNYQLLFQRNPMSMWIVSESTLEIIDVNEAAIDHYGYSKDEFLKLNSKDLRPREDIERYIDSMDQEPKREHGGIWRHKKKDGTIIMVDIITDRIIYQDQKARLILANDITDKLNAEAELVSHRIMQQELITETTIQVQEKEREELGKELHDNVNQILAATKLYLELALSGNPELAKKAISKSYENITMAIGEIRQLSKQLVPPFLDTTLVEALRDLIDEIQVITPLKISLILSNFREMLLPENLKLMVYRIVQEQINNILKHAAASSVDIKLELGPENFSLVIFDNGVGFDVTKKSKGIGLRNIDNRVKFYNGFTTIISEPGKGFRLEISVPVHNRERFET